MWVCVCVCVFVCVCVCVWVCVTVVCVCVCVCVWWCWLFACRVIQSRSCVTHIFRKSWMFSERSEMYMYPSDFCLVSLTKPFSSSLPPLSSPSPSQEHNRWGYKASSPQMRTCLGAGRKMSSQHEFVLYLYTTHAHTHSQKTAWNVTTDAEASKPLGDKFSLLPHLHTPHLPLHQWKEEWGESRSFNWGTHSTVLFFS